MRPPSLRRYGRFIHANALKLLVGSVLALFIASVAIKSAQIDSELTSWIQRTTRINLELQQAEAALPSGSGSRQLLISQTSSQSRANILTVDALMIHLEAMAIAAHLTVDAYDVTWSLKDLCYTPTLPDYEGAHVSLMLENMMPCAIKTPLDCFWEGAKLLGPDQSITISSLAPKLKWTNMHPRLMVSQMRDAHPHASFPYTSLLDWMQRVGINSGYQFKPCLDPLDPNCPISAPNKISSQSPDVAAELTGGCRGVAERQMHWLEDELVGGSQRNKSGYLTRAAALQSTISLMGEQDMYDYWRKTSKVQDINNWSSDKAKLVLETWQRRFKDELRQFTRTALSSRPYQIHALTSTALLEPISGEAVLDSSNFQICFAFMTIIFCVTFPSFTKVTSEGTTSASTIDRAKSTLLSISLALIVGLIFIASLGISSFMNLTINMATTHILPPLALYYGFNQFSMISNVYAQNYKHQTSTEITISSLSEVVPVIIIESIAYALTMFCSTTIPIRATRTLAFQAIIFIVITTIAAIFLVPCCIITFLKLYAPEAHEPRQRRQKISGRIIDKDNRSDTVFAIKTKRPMSRNTTEKPNTVNEQSEIDILSRLQNDLKHIRADSAQSNVNFSAELDAGSFKTSINLRTSETSKRRPIIGKSETTQHPSIAHDNEEVPLNRALPDIITSSYIKTQANDDLKAIAELKPIEMEPKKQESNESNDADSEQSIVDSYAKSFLSNRYAQAAVCLIKILSLVAMFVNGRETEYGLQVRDIVSRNTEEYKAFFVQEQYFPIHNIYLVTTGNIDYPANQKRLHEFHYAISHVDGIIGESHQSRPKFWLSYFRDWLLEVQEKFDIDRNNSLITVDGWKEEASGMAKIGYKLILQTGKIDNPIDKSLFETNRLVDKNGLINQKSFYHCLSAWVMNDAFTYATSEANLRPEPKSWNLNSDDLRVEKARPLMYAQMPFTMKLPEGSRNLETISEIRSISEVFEQINLPNFPIGMPFVFWDQFLNLELLSFIALVVGFSSIYIIISIITTSATAPAIIAIPMVMTVLESYFLLNYLSVPFNNIIAVLMIGNMGLAVEQTVHYTCVSYL